MHHSTPESGSAGRLLKRHVRDREYTPPAAVVSASLRLAPTAANCLLKEGVNPSLTMVIVQENAKPRSAIELISDP